MAKVGSGRCGRGEGRANINDPHALLSHGVVWLDPLIENLLSMYKRKYIGLNHNLVAKHQCQVMLHVFNERANVQFIGDNLISRIDS